MSSRRLSGHGGNAYTVGAYNCTKMRLLLTADLHYNHHRGKALAEQTHRSNEPPPAAMC